MATGQIGTKPLAGAWNIHAKLLGGRRMGGASITRGFGGTAAGETQPRPIGEGLEASHDKGRPLCSFGTPGGPFGAVFDGSKLRA
jgi:hypothetical protein